MSTPHTLYADDTATSEAYATKLHHALKAAAVDHKVVKYDYHFTTRMSEGAVGTRTAVIYRDEIYPGNPWWLAEQEIARPVWIPGEHPESQIAFYIHHPVDVVNEKDYSEGGRDHKATVAIAHSGHGYQYSGHSKPASHPIRFRTAPSTSDFEFAAVLPESAGQRLYYASLFRSIHGRNYDPASASDRQEMAKLHKNAPRHRQPLAAQAY